ncbi:hypothetical protein PRZ48_003808 [Zasmidium cellare]|uniref:Glucose receptor Git3-like N-terminal domain-containing protein n=1 Tax=Zasmidium cellare TaxID=395010 RepID=A0ABR0EXP4_ZASCE|nr:hypothetical protein PRZ48_003808 [Zasmidium cellare]
MALLLVVAIPTFICSLLSLIADTIFAVFYWALPPERHYRQALIVNLLIADWINALNNTISGAIALSRRNDEKQLTKGPACTANGYIGQFSVQAIDFNILIISFAVLLTVRQSSITMEPPWWAIVLICILPWIPSVITSNIALGLDAYGPVSGNWCWIRPNLVLRYTLTHGWRLAIFFLTIGIYTYVYLYLKRVYGKLNLSTDSSATQDDLDLNLAEELPEMKRTAHGHIRTLSVATNHESDEQPLSPTLRRGAPSTDDITQSRSSVALAGRKSHGELQRVTTFGNAQSAARKKALRKMLLLNGYPVLYVILWIPGIANRIVETVGESPTWLKALQASTQLVGFANALTYAWNEQLSKRVKSRWKFMRRTNRRPTVLPSRDTTGFV